MLELERLGVRVVSGRLGKGNDDEDGDDGSDDGEKSSGMDNKMMGGGTNNMMGGNNNIGGVSMRNLKYYLHSHRSKLISSFSSLQCYQQ